MSTKHYILPFQTSYAQQEEAFKSLADRLVASDEEKSRLEALVAQLEMDPPQSGSTSSCLHTDANIRFVAIDRRIHLSRQYISTLSQNPPCLLSSM